MSNEITPDDLYEEVRKEIEEQRKNKQKSSANTSSKVGAETVDPRRSQTVNTRTGSNDNQVLVENANKKSSREFNDRKRRAEQRIKEAKGNAERFKNEAKQLARNAIQTGTNPPQQYNVLIEASNKALKEYDLRVEEFTATYKVDPKAVTDSRETINSAGPKQSVQPSVSKPLSPYDVVTDETSAADAIKKKGITGYPDFSTKAPGGSADNEYWVNAFGGVQEDGGLVLVKGDELDAAGSYSFIADKSGKIYRDQTNLNRPESMGTTANRILQEMSTSGQLNKFRDMLIANGIATGSDVTALNAAKQYTSNFGDTTTRKYIYGLLSEASQMNASIANEAKGKNATPKFISFDDFVKVFKPTKGGLFGSSGGGGGGGYSLPKRTVTTTRQNFTTADFEIAIDDLYQKTTGRGADENEVKQLVDFLNKQSPQKSVSIRNGDNTTTTVSGGVSSDMIQEQMRTQALNDPNAENYNKATKYMNYFMEALNSPIKLG